jgi:TIR domain
MPQIFICCPRFELREMAERIHRRLCDRFGRRAAVIGERMLPPDDFRRYVAEMIGHSDVMLVLIGRRLDRDEMPPIDPVRVEIEAASARGIPIILVPIADSDMLHPSELPASVRGLSNAHTVAIGPGFERGVVELIRSIERVTGQAGDRSAAVAGRGPRGALTLGQMAELRAGIDVIERDAAVVEIAPIPPPPPQESMATPPVVPAAYPGPPIPPPEPPPAARSSARRIGSYAAAAAGAILVGAGGLSYYESVIAPQTSSAPGPPPQPGPSHAIEFDLTDFCRRPSPLTFRDDFAAPDPALGSADPSKVVYRSKGQLIIRPQPGETIARLYPSIEYQRGWVCVTVRVPDGPPAASSDDNAGAVFWASDPENYHAAVVFRDGMYGVYRKQNGAVTTIVPKQAFSAVSSKHGEGNAVQVLFDGPPYEVLINGRKAGTIEGTAGAVSGAVGLVAQSARASRTDWSFSAILAGSDRPVRKSAPALRPKPGRVDISVFSRDLVRAGEDVLVQVFFHRPKDEKTVAGLATEGDHAARRRGRQTLQSDVAVGEQLEVRLEAPRLQVDQPMQEFTWRGQPEACQFLVSLPDDAAGRTYHLIVHVLRKAMPIGKIIFALQGAGLQAMLDERVDIPPADVWRYKRAFVSYSSIDREEVLKGVQYLKAAGIEIVQDVLSFEPGRPWQQQIRDQIDRCDLFFLFWSSHAASSDMVRQEAEYAMQRRRASGGHKPQITPFILEGPPPPAPPPTLAELHFNDPIRYVIAAEAAARASR